MEQQVTSLVICERRENKLVEAKDFISEAVGTLALKNQELVSGMALSPVTNQNEANQMKSYLATLRTKQKEAESLREPLSKPIFDFKKWIDDLFKKAKSPLELAEQQVLMHLRDWDDSERKRIEKERLDNLRKATEEAKRLQEKQAKVFDKVDAVNLPVAGGLQAIPEIIPQQVEQAPKTVRLDSGGTVTRKEDWTFEVINTDLIPRMYLSVNEQAIRQVVKALKDKTNIPGIRVWDKGSYATRG